MIFRRWILPAAAGDGREGKKTRSGSDLPHTRIREVGFLLLLTAWFLMMECLLAKGEPFCEPVDPARNEQVLCEATGSNNSWCSVTSSYKNHCYFTYRACWIRPIPYNISNINGSTVISDINETSWPIVIWTVDPEGWWFVDVKDADEVAILGLPGNISSEEPPALFNASRCSGCPPPKFEWFPDPESHQIRFLVPNDTKVGHTSNTEVQLLLFSSNETNFYRTCKNHYKNTSAIIKSSVGEYIRFSNVYSREICVRFILPPITENGVMVNQEYHCGRQIDMREYPKGIVHGEIPVPLWMNIVPAVFMLLIVFLAIFLFGTSKGWITVPAHRRIHENRPVTSVAATSGTSLVSDVERNQQLTSTNEEQAPFIENNVPGNDLDAREDYS